MSTCRDCIHCRVLATCWICKRDEMPKKLVKLRLEGMEECSGFRDDILINILSWRFKDRRKKPMTVLA